MPEDHPMRLKMLQRLFDCYVKTRQIEKGERLGQRLKQFGILTPSLKRLKLVKARMRKNASLRKNSLRPFTKTLKQRIKSLSKKISAIVKAFKIS